MPGQLQRVLGFVFEFVNFLNTDLDILEFKNGNLWRTWKSVWARQCSVRRHRLHGQGCRRSPWSPTFREGVKQEGGAYSTFLLLLYIYIRAMQNTTINSKFMFFKISGPLIEMDMVDCVRSWQVGVRKRKNGKREKEKREEKRKRLRGRHRYFGRLASSVLNIGGSKQLSLSAECLQCD